MNNKFLHSGDRAASRWGHTAFLTAVGAVYLYFYLVHPALPGNNPNYPLGWWGWFDQGEYIKAARALFKLNLSSENFFYPPLYSVLGALFVPFTSDHPFAIVDLACLLLYTHFFVLFARQFVGWLAAVAAFVASFLMSTALLDIWVEPWTTTLVAALSAPLVYDITRGHGSPISTLRAMGWGLLAGAVVLTRPVDAAILAPLLAFAVYRLWAQEHREVDGRRHKPVIALLLGGALGILLFAAFNLLVHGHPAGNYLSMATNNGFHPVDFPEKSVSLLMDSGTLYNESGSALFTQLNWLALFVPAAIYVALRGPAAFRVLLVVMAVHLVLYASYADLLPTGLWRYHNVHYFKWLLPYASLLILWFLVEAIRFERRTRLPAIASALAGLLLLCVQLKLHEVPMAHPFAEPIASGTYSIAFEHPTEVDKVEIPGLAGEFNPTYFGEGVAVRVDGRPMRFVRDFRFMPSERGTDLLFIRPVEATSIEFEIGKMKADDGPLTVQPKTYRFALGWPAWLSDKDATPRAGNLLPRYQATLAEGIQFNRPGYPLFLEGVHGMSGLEPWGRWSDTDKDGKVGFYFIRPLPRNFDLHLRVGAFGRNLNSQVKVTVGDVTHSFKVQTAEPQTYVLAFSTSGTANAIEISVPHPVSPGGADKRLLGLSFNSLQVVDRQ